MASGQQVAKAGCKYLGCPYSEMDCQRFVEKALSDCGVIKDLSGSNTWYRYIMQNGWVGSPKECKDMFGAIPEGAFLFIHAFDGGEPAKYQNDGIGNASHIGIYTAMTGAEMVALAIAEGDAIADRYNFGNGAIHSSRTRDAVATSNFSGKSISGGWNKVGLWNVISYGEPYDSILRGESPDEGGAIMTATVYAENGSTVNMRERKSTKSDLVDRVPIGDQVEVLETDPEWSYCRWHKKTGYIMTSFLLPGECVPGDDGGSESTPEGMIMVNAAELERIYAAIGNLLGVRG